MTPRAFVVCLLLLLLPWFVERLRTTPAQRESRSIARTQTLALSAVCAVLLVVRFCLERF